MRISFSKQEVHFLCSKGKISKQQHPVSSHSWPVSTSWFISTDTLLTVVQCPAVRQLLIWHYYDAIRYAFWFNPVDQSTTGDGTVISPRSNSPSLVVIWCGLIVKKRKQINILLDHWEHWLLMWLTHTHQMLQHHHSIYIQMKETCFMWSKIAKHGFLASKDTLCFPSVPWSFLTHCIILKAHSKAGITPLMTIPQCLSRITCNPRMII